MMFPADPFQTSAEIKHTDPPPIDGHRAAEQCVIVIRWKPCNDPC